jgi:hypothetical protein
MRRIVRVVALMTVAPAAILSTGGSASARLACGPTFAQVSSPNGASGNTFVSDADATSPANAWAVGGGDSGGFSIHWDGSSWQAKAVPAVGPGETLGAVGMAGPHDVWAVGSFDNPHGKARTLALRRTGSTWVRVPSRNDGLGDNDLYELSVVSTDDVWAAGTATVGGVDRVLLQHWNGVKWKLVSFPALVSTDNFLEGMTAAGPGDVWVSVQFADPMTHADRVTTFHRTGSTWQHVTLTQPSAGDVEPRALLAIAPNDVWMAGFFHKNGKELVLLERWNGTHWTRFAGVNASGSGETFLEGLAALGPHAVYAFGGTLHGSEDAPFAERYDGTSWKRVTTNLPSGGSFFYGGAAAPGSNRHVWGVGFVQPGGGTERTLVEQACP